MRGTTRKVIEPAPFVKPVHAVNWLRIAGASSLPRVSPNIEMLAPRQRPSPNRLNKNRLIGTEWI